jgi:hypothetical protein
LANDDALRRRPPVFRPGLDELCPIRNWYTDDTKFLNDRLRIFNFDELHVNIRARWELLPEGFAGRKLVSQIPGEGTVFRRCETDLRKRVQQKLTVYD